MRITVFSRGPGLYSTRRLVEAGEQRGHAISVVDHSLCSPYADGEKSSILMNGLPFDEPEVAIPRIGANITTRGVALIRQLDVMGVPHVLDANALLLARDKMSCLQRLTQEGIGVPRTVLCFSVYEVRKVAKRLGPFPVVVKLLESTHGVGVALAHNLYQLERLAEGFLQLQDRILLQEYIRESKGSDLRAFVVGDRIVAAMQRKAVAGEFRANIHRGATATPVTLSPEEQALVLRVASVIGVEIAGVDLIHSHRGPLVMEVNASPGLEGIEGATRVDIAGAIISYAESKV
ncbi:SSU ribosomal protein S6P modification protein [Neolewinella xylanilytica]|uniref:SSU ribosomal protein S6P modification protein n=1 Tax=Neolewinella xylanilytica TaxID=1514080 RepID=A0A2S6I5H4_9BACT|nr:RimK family alpha-L-glutamate ligase [Neolewinella xylanilytica]PPK86424.1 SSU ribosomal protein S6P modification protein [Neolewinella xylanilytica]